MRLPEWHPLLPRWAYWKTRSWLLLVGQGVTSCSFLILSKDNDPAGVQAQGKFYCSKVKVKGNEGACISA